MFVGPQYGICFLSPYGRLQFGGTKPRFLENLFNPAFSFCFYCPEVGLLDWSISLFSFVPWGKRRDRKIRLKAQNFAIHYSLIISLFHFTILAIYSKFTRAINKYPVLSIIQTRDYRFFLRKTVLCKEFCG